MHPVFFSGLVTLCILQFTCQKVAAMGKPRRLWLGIVYDELVRKSWSERAHNNDASLDIAKEAASINKDILLEAEAKYDEIEASFPMFLHYFRFASILLCMF